jgi:hypothetical protein
MSRSMAARLWAVTRPAAALLRTALRATMPLRLM